MIEKTETTEPKKKRGGQPKAEVALTNVKIVTKNKSETKPCVLEDEVKVAKLELAFRNGATLDQAALFAMVGTTTIKSNMKKNTPMLIGDEPKKGEKDERVEMGFKELVNLWRGDMGLLAKKKIRNVLADPDNKDTTDAWRYLERKEKKDWGLDSGHIDEGGDVNIDLGAEATKRLKKYE